MGDRSGDVQAVIADGEFGPSRIIDHRVFADHENLGQDGILLGINPECVPLMLAIGS